MQGFDFVHREPVRFRDVDAMGHVNNAVFLTYMESARTEFLIQRGAVKSLDDVVIVIARIEIDFRSPIRFGDAVEVGVRASRFGSKSFDLEYELRADGRVAAEAKSVCVGYDYASRESRPIPDAWRTLLAPRPRAQTVATD